MTSKLYIQIKRRIFIDDEPTDYFISCDGYVYKQLPSGEYKKYNGTIKGTDYRKTNITHNGKQHLCYNHRLVAKMFLSNNENKRVVNHKDGNKLNNSVDNLEWATDKENVDHAILNGLNILKHGELSHFSRNTTEDITHVCELLEKNVPLKNISDITGVGYDAIKLIRRDKTWKHISKNYNFEKPKKKKKILYGRKE